MKRLMMMVAGMSALVSMAQVVSFNPAKAVDTGFRAYWAEPGETSVGVKVTTSAKSILNLAKTDPFAGAWWIWHPRTQQAKGLVKFRAKLSLPAAVVDGTFAMSCDNGAVLSVNGRELTRQGNGVHDWETITRVKSLAGVGFRAGENLIEADGDNILPGDAGLLAAFDMKLADGSTKRFTTGDATWEASLDGVKWVPVMRVGEYGCGPWGIFDTNDHGRNPAQHSVATKGEFALLSLPEGGKVWLVGDEVEGGKDARILVNGREAGVFAKPPHRLDISGLVKAGRNEFTTEPYKLWNPRVVVGPAKAGRSDGLGAIVGPAKAGRSDGLGAIVGPAKAGRSDGLGAAKGISERSALADLTRPTRLTGPTGLTRPTGLTGLTCEYMAEPLGVVKPRFFWKFTGPRPKSFTLDVATSPAKLAAGDVWHGEVKEHLYVEPPLKLEPFTRYWWRVGMAPAACNGGVAGENSAAASFVTGIEAWRQPFMAPHWAKRREEYWRARKTVELQGAKSVVLGICSRGYHKLFVNGQAVETAFGPNRSHIQDGFLLAETYDVTRFVKDGANEIEIIVADGWARVCRKSSCLSVDGRAVTAQGVVAIDSSTPWLTSKVNDQAIGGWGFGNFGGERIHDVRKFSDEKPGKQLAEAKFSISCDVSPRDRVLKELPAVSVEKVGKKTWRVDFGEEFTGFVRMRLRGKPGEVVGLDMSDTIVTRRQVNQRWEYVFCEGGKGEFSSLLNWTAGRYAHLEGLEDLEPSEVTGLAVGNFARRTGEFKGDLDLEKALWIDNNTLIATSFSGVTVDCPHRERLGYGEASLSSMWGDGLPYFDSAAYYYAYLLKWASSQEPDGHIPHVSPDADGGGGTFWSNFPIYAFADYWRMYPDTRLREVIHPVAAKWLDYLHSKVKDGLVRKYEPGKYGCLGDWAFPDANVRDWGQSREALFFNNCSYAWAILRALETEGLVPESARRAELQRRHAALVAAIEKEFYRDGIYIAPHARYQAIAIVGGVAAAFGHERETEQAMLDIVERKGYVDGGSPSYTTILRVMGRSARGRELVLKTFRRHKEPGYLFFVDQSYSTIPEYWNFGFHFQGSMIHTCFTGGAGALMYGLAGFDVKGDEITVAPFLSRQLPNYEARMETLYGTVALQVRTLADGSMRVEVECPAGCRGRFVGERSEVLHPGRNVFQCLNPRR